MGLRQDLKLYKRIATNVDEGLRLASDRSARFIANNLSPNSKLGNRIIRDEVGTHLHTSLRRKLIRESLERAGSKRFNGVKTKLLEKYLDRTHKKSK